MRFAPLPSIVALAVLAVGAPQPTIQREGTTIPITKHSRLVQNDKTVDFNAVHLHVASVRAKILRGLDSYLKNTRTIHPSAVKDVDKRGYGDPLTDYEGALWYGNITVGTPPATLTVQFDTGSSDLFVASSLCNSSCNGHALWDPKSSSSARDMHSTSTFHFGSGDSARAEKYTDTVSIGTFTGTSQTLGAVTFYSPGFGIANYPVDGLMGMGFQSISVFDDSPFFQTLVSERKVTDSVFSFKLSSHKAELYLGGSNRAMYTGNFSYAPVKHRGFWQVNMDNIQGNGQTVLSNVSAVIDTGTSVIIGPPSDVSKMYNALGGQPVVSADGGGFYTFPCESFPSISFGFGGTSFSIPASSLNLGPNLPDSPSDCVSAIIGQNVGISSWVVGDTFLQSVYTVFDVGNARVGFAHLA